MENNLDSTGQQYTVTATNNSDNFGSFCLFQNREDSGPSAATLAWLVEPAYPSTRVRFEWSPDFCFVWGPTGQLMPGVIFFAAETIPAQLDAKNQITLDYQGAFLFQNPTNGQSGSLTITDTARVPMGQASVGIGMSGKATLVVPAMPNMNNAFTPHPKFWIAFGEFKRGQVLDVESLGNTAEIVFPPNVYNMSATLNPDNTWSIDPSE
jgi:rhizosphere induced protein